MPKAGISIPDLLDKLEKFYGKQEPCWPVDPYEFIVWWHCGYPASDAACTKGWDKLKSQVGIEPHNLLAATPRKLAFALKPGGIVPELRALRLKEVAMRVKDKLGGDLRAAPAGPLSSRVTMSPRRWIKRRSQWVDATLSLKSTCWNLKG